MTRDCFRLRTVVAPHFRFGDLVIAPHGAGGASTTPSHFGVASRSLD